MQLAHSSFDFSRILLLTVISCFCLLSCDSEKNYAPADLTSEKIFSENIEGPVWRDSCWYLVNFQQDGTIGIVNPSGKVNLFVNLPAGSNANAIQFNSKGEMLLADWPMNQILKVDLQTRQVSVFVHDSVFYQPNDLTVNSRDQIFASDPDWKNGTGRIWRINPDGTRMILRDQMGTTNGICLDPTEEILYVNESVQRKVWAFKLDSSGNLSDPKLFASFNDYGLDGMKCDREGNLYVTRHGKGTVAVFSPNGQLMREIVLKGEKPSNLAFGGPDGRTCIVTLQDRGSIEFFRTEVPGIGF